MDAIISLANKAQDYLEKLSVLDFLAPLLLRLYLVPVFWMAGTQKLSHIDSTSQWFGSIGIPLPTLNAWLASLTEAGGAILLLFGFATRWISIPLMFTMIVAAVTVHLQYGWLAIATGSGFFATERTVGAVQRLDRAKDILKEHGNYSWLTENGSFVVLNNGIEFAATYFVMLLALFYLGAGKLSVDHFIAKAFRK